MSIDDWLKVSQHSHQLDSTHFSAGSRNENYDSLGAAHLLRIAAGLSTKKASQFGICRNIQQAGGSLTVTGDREILAYTLEVTRDQLETALQFLENTCIGQVFKPWEIEGELALICTCSE